MVAMKVSLDALGSVARLEADLVEFPVLADSVSSRPSLTVDLGRPSPRVECQLNGALANSQSRPGAVS
jgi:hypothetical protein